MRDYDKQYRVQLCAACDHPGGQHIIDRGCRLCDCDGWVEGVNGWWSDRMTSDAERRWLMAEEIAIDAAEIGRRPSDG